jgi:predicted nucleotidyltransferase
MVTKLGFFGSPLNGARRLGSDLDIAIELQKPPGYETVTVHGFARQTGL